MCANTSQSNENENNNNTNNDDGTPQQEKKNDSQTSSSAEEGGDSNNNKNGAVKIRTKLCGPPQTIRSGRELGVWDASLEDQSNCLGDWLLSYLNPLLALGSHKVLDADDIGVPSRQDKADRAYEVALAAWEEQSQKAHAANEKLKQAYQAKLNACSSTEEREKVKEPVYKEPSVALALIKGFGGGRVLWAVLLQVVASFMQFVPVLILNSLVTFFESGDPIPEFDITRPTDHPWFQVAALGIVPFLISALSTRSSVIMAHAAVFARTAVSTLLYRKALRVSAAGRAVTSTGQVVNMMSNDTAQLQRFLQFIGFILTAPLQIVLALYLIFDQVSL